MTMTIFTNKPHWPRAVGIAGDYAGSYEIPGLEPRDTERFDIYDQGASYTVQSANGATVNYHNERLNFSTKHSSAERRILLDNRFRAAKPAPEPVKSDGARMFEVGHGTGVRCNRDDVHSMVVSVADGLAADFVAYCRETVDAALAARDEQHRRELEGLRTKLIDEACEWYVNKKYTVSVGNLRNTLESVATEPTVEAK
jgi:hypothetical protein